MSNMKVHNATFYCFKGWNLSRKYYASDRGALPKEVFDVHTADERLALIIKHNKGCWPGLSGPGESYFRFVVADADVNHGWPLMFDPTREGVFPAQPEEK